MIVTLEETKNWLKDVPEEDNPVVEMLIQAAETYLHNATGNQFDSTNQLAKLFCMVLITDWYENREAVGRTTDKTRPIVESMVGQLKHCYELPLEVAP